MNETKERKKMNENVIEQPVAAMYMVSKELNRLAGFTTEMLFSLKSTIMSNRSEESQQKFTEKLQYETVPSAGLFSHPELYRLLFRLTGLCMLQLAGRFFYYCIQIRILRVKYKMMA